jgi:hypothetical protein
MSIQVICPNVKCRERFVVSDKFAGQTGPCPKCKSPIRIPKKEEDIKIHAPEDAGPKDASGKLVLKPIARKDAKFSIVLAVIIGVMVVVALGGAYAIGVVFEGNAPWWILAPGAVLLAIPLGYGGYAFLRDDELEPYSGQELLVRSVIAAAIYASIWGIFALLRVFVFPEGISLMVLAIVGLPLAAVGAVAAYGSLDLSFGSAALHFGLYAVFTLALALLMKVDLIGDPSNAPRRGPRKSPTQTTPAPSAAPVKPRRADSIELRKNAPHVRLS